MRRNRFAGPIGTLALTLTLVAGCADAPTSPVSEPALASTLPPPEGAKGLCPQGWGLIRIEDLPADKQEKAEDIDDRGTVPGIGPRGNLDGFVCIKGSSDNLRIIDNYLPLEQ